MKTSSTAALLVSDHDYFVLGYPLAMKCASRGLSGTFISADGSVAFRMGIAW